MVTKEIYKYPYNVKPEDDLKVFLSEIICEQVVKVNCRNGQFFVLLKIKLLLIIRKLYYQLVLFSLYYSVCLMNRARLEFHQYSL